MRFHSYGFSKPCSWIDDCGFVYSWAVLRCGNEQFRGTSESETRLIGNEHRFRKRLAFAEPAGNDGSSAGGKRIAQKSIVLYENKISSGSGSHAGNACQPDIAISLDFAADKLRNFEQ